MLDAGVMRINSRQRCRFLVFVLAFSPFLLEMRVDSQESCRGCRATPAASGRQSPPGDKLLRALIDDADSVSPEFKSDVLLSLVESGKITDLALRKKLINQAFSAAEAVQPPYAEAPYGRVGNTAQSRKAVALSMTQLDRMSLQSRAVHDMHQLSSLRAKGLFDEMPFPSLGPLDCGDNWLYDPGPFYAALAEVAKTDFSAKDISSGERARFLSPLVGHISSHAQVVPLAHMMATGGLTDAELRDVLPIFSGSLQSIPDDEHTFAVIAEDDGKYVQSVYGTGLIEAMLELVSAAERSGVPPGPTVSAFRSYLVQNFNQPRCDTDHPPDATTKELLPASVIRFNQTFEVDLRQTGLAPIASSEIEKAAVMPSRLRDDAPDESYDAKQLTDALQKLHGSKNQHTDKNGSVALEWWHELDDFLSHFDAWRQGDETEADFVREKSDFCMSLIDLIPPSPQQHKVLSDFISLLEQHSYQHLGGAEWFIYVKLLYMGVYARSSHGDLLDAFLNSRDPVLRLYARLDRWAGRPIGPHWPAGS